MEFESSPSPPQPPNESFSRCYKFLWPLLLTANLPIGENLLEELSSYHGPIISQMKQMVEVYIKLAELETRREDTNKRITLRREIRYLRQLELINSVPVVTATFPIDRTGQYHEASFPYFRGLANSVMVMNGINAPKVVECFGSDGRKYRQLAKSGNDDLRQDNMRE